MLRATDIVADMHGTDCYRQKLQCTYIVQARPYYVGDNVRTDSCPKATSAITCSTTIVGAWFAKQKKSQAWLKQICAQATMHAGLFLPAGSKNYTSLRRETTLQVPPSRKHLLTDFLKYTKCLSMHIHQWSTFLRLQKKQDVGARTSGPQYTPKCKAQNICSPAAIIHVFIKHEEV